MAASEDTHPRDLVFLQLEAERQRQDRKWGEQNHPNGTGGQGDLWLARKARMRCEQRFVQGHGSWKDILLEEVWEALAENDLAALRAELIQVAAVAVAWVEAIDRRAA